MSTHRVIWVNGRIPGEQIVRRIIARAYMLPPGRGDSWACRYDSVRAALVFAARGVLRGLDDRELARGYSALVADAIASGPGEGELSPESRAAEHARIFRLAIAEARAMIRGAGRETKASSLRRYRGR